MEESSSPAAATTAEEAMVSTGEGEAPPPGLSVDGSSQCSSGPRAGHDEVAPEVEPWAAAVPPKESEQEKRSILSPFMDGTGMEWVPIIRHDMLSQRKIKAQPPLSDAYLHGMPAKRRKTSQCEGPHLSLSDAVSRAARAVGVLPVSSPNSLQVELESPEIQDAYAKQVKCDITQRVRDDPDFTGQRFPNTHRAFSIEDS